MNGSSNPSPELRLPAPSPELGISSVEIPSSIETKSGGVDSVSQGPATAIPAVDPSQFASSSTATTAVVSDDDAKAAGADDADVIEKEWVTKAKAIVNKTRNNPNEQSTELSKFKAEYIKKRFNKEIKTVKETPPSL